MSLTGSCFSSESAPGPFHYGISRTRWNNLSGGLAVRLTAGPSGQTNSPHPSSREGHHSTARWSSGFLLSLLILIRSHAAAASRVQQNSVPSTHMRCIITASRRARATIAFFIPRRLAICIAQRRAHAGRLVLGTRLRPPPRGRRRTLRRRRAGTVVRAANAMRELRPPRRGRTAELAGARARGRVPGSHVMQPTGLF
jgi:hypothetical protein